MFFILEYKAVTWKSYCQKKEEDLDKPRYEKELYEPARDFLVKRGWDVKAEVRDCDIAAVKDDLFLVCEMKLSLNLEVILQATKRQRIADLVYIVIPGGGKTINSKRYKDIFHLLRRLEIGLILILPSPSGHVAREYLQPKKFNRATAMSRFSKEKQAAIDEFLKRSKDLNVGGVNRGKIITAYREMAIRIAFLMKEKGPLSLKEIHGHGFDRKKAQRMLGDNFYGWFERISRGVYGLSKRGANEIEEFKYVVDKTRDVPH